MGLARVQTLDAPVTRRHIVLIGVLLGAGFGVWNLLSSLLDPLAEDTIPSRFQATESESLRTFINYHYVTQAPFKILVATTIGGVTGVIGGFFGAWLMVITRRHARCAQNVCDELLLISSSPVHL